ncbi:SdpI family protein [Actinomadura barringtoniae]|uniref:SdpI family protein n=1 Tax=Actinomadura barringtoniae TaxID=1427535 RepID=A0A939PKG1_9ACTN|nr:SdpI family protein [Actinomadura barringtoniae]MBO2453965.1 SdpI family protein [Actinomadura barringtoniae]
MQHYVFGTIIVLAGVMIAVVGRRTGQGKLGRNRKAGIRTATTLASDEAWLTVHRAAEPWTIAGGLAMIICGLAALGIQHNGIAAVVAGLGALLGAGLSIIGAVVGHSVLRAR